MDPDAALEEMLKQVQLILHGSVNGQLSGGGLRTAATLLAESAEALNDWLTAGGFLPGEWAKHRGHVEIMHVRDPDFECDHTVFVDGVETVVTIESVDPGAGYTADWNDTTEEIATNRLYSGNFRTKIVEARNDAAENSPYIGHRYLLGPVDSHEDKEAN